MSTNNKKYHHHAKKKTHPYRNGSWVSCTILGMMLNAPELPNISSKYKNCKLGGQFSISKILHRHQKYCVSRAGFSSLK